MLWARPTPAGERVWLWLRPGLDLTDLDGKTGKVAVACWAGEVRVVRASARFAALVRVDMTRRDPLAGDGAVAAGGAAHALRVSANATGVRGGADRSAWTWPTSPKPAPEPRGRSPLTARAAGSVAGPATPQ